MKTQKEIEQMKNEISEEIRKLSSEICNCNDVSDIMFKSERNRQLMAQYNILLEVLR